MTTIGWGRARRSGASRSPGWPARKRSGTGWATTRPRSPTPSRPRQMRRPPRWSPCAGAVSPRWPRPRTPSPWPPRTRSLLSPSCSARAARRPRCPCGAPRPGLLGPSGCGAAASDDEKRKSSSWSSSPAT
jgi:hypothetical protein